MIAETYRTDLHKVVWKYAGFSRQENKTRKQLEEGCGKKSKWFSSLKCISNIQYKAGSCSWIPPCYPTRFIETNTVTLSNLQPTFNISILYGATDGAE